MAEQVRASHILVSDKQKAENIKKQIENGKDFETLAKEASEGPSSENGGDLGFFGKGDMVKPFERKAFSLDVGEVSDPVKTEFGYHIIKKTDEK
ncbi:MAG: peptidylprolyl isomerase [Candidatus Nanohaloarchaea archaeon]